MTETQKAAELAQAIIVLEMLEEQFDQAAITTGQHEGEVARGAQTVFREQ